MQLGMVGLGRMGANMTTRLIEKGHEVVAFDVSDDAVARAQEGGATGVHSLDDLVRALAPPRVVWTMVPAGEITEQTISDLGTKLESDDVVIDGGNSRYVDSIRRGETLAEKGISFLDAGTSGGIWGLKEGYCLMVGGDADVVAHAQPIFEALAPENGFAHVGPIGAGHFTKMVHNGVEYALMQAYGEGFEILESSEFDLDVGQIAEVWRHGSVVRSWLLDLAARALTNDPGLEDVAPYVDDSGEGRWTLTYGIDNAIPIPTIATALFARFASRQDASFAAKVIAALRREFGGHAIHESER
ncbi:MAG TPA: decarboxylating 6-phosphogluconate dehydrogenase [Actinomycetota bacterium]|nr:decarboxylating 6-phosphogluconate dehydrogenase [Actinomycetota bacterium]